VACLIIAINRFPCFHLVNNHLDHFGANYFSKGVFLININFVQPFVRMLFFYRQSIYTYIKA